MSDVTFECNMNGYVTMVQYLLNSSLSIITMFQSTIYYIISGMPDLAAAWEYTYGFITGAGDWIGYLMAAVYYFGIDFNYADELCTFSEYGYVAIYYMNMIMSFGAEMGLDE